MLFSDPIRLPMRGLKADVAPKLARLVRLTEDPIALLPSSCLTEMLIQREEFQTLVLKRIGFAGVDHLFA